MVVNLIAAYHLEEHRGLSWMGVVIGTGLGLTLVGQLFTEHRSTLAGIVALIIVTVAFRLRILRKLSASS